MIKKLVLGPGPGFQERKRKDAENGIDTFGIDIIKEFEPDMVLDIRGVDLPFDEGSFDEIEIFHCMEHIQMNEDFLHLMKEMFRVLKNDGYLEITVPHKDSNMAYDCYEHCRFFTENSFMNFYENRYAKEMGIPLFKHVLNEKRPKDGEFEVHVILQKP